MPGTKIINVFKDDKFEDILEIFRNTPAQEVIFVLPKKCKSFKGEESFALLASESEELSKAVLILSENPQMNDFATKYNFGVLTSEDDDDDREEDEPVVTEEQSIEPEQDSFKAEESFQPEEQPEEELAAKEDGNLIDYNVGHDHDGESILVVNPQPPKTVSDIVRPNPDNAVNLKLNQKPERPASDLGIKSEPDNFMKRAEDIKSVWQRRETPAPAAKPPVMRTSAFSLRSLFSGSSKKVLSLLFVGAVFIFAAVLYVSMGKAEVLIKPRAHAVNFNLKVSSSDTVLAVDADLKRIPGQLFSVEKRIEETFPATGEKDVVQKARGRITVYNEFGTTPQVLIATTRFESENGLIFRSLTTATVPGTKVQNGKIIPGSIVVEVIADKAGDTYNIPAGKFTIPAFKEKGDNDRYQKFYGMSEAAMKGGIIGKAKVVTEQDYINAKKAVEENIIKATEEELKSQATDLKILSLSAPSVEEITPSAQIDEAVDSFKVVGVAELQTVGFKDSDLFDLLTQYIQDINDVVVFPDKLTLKFENVTFNPETKSLEFTVAVDGTAYSRVDEEKIISDLMGKGEDDIKDYIKTINTVSSAKVVLSPFWVWKVPAEKERIRVKLEY